MARRLEKSERKIIALLFLLPLLGLASLLISALVKANIKARRTQALVTYVQANLCGDSVGDRCYTEEIDWLIDNGADLNATMPNGEPIVRWCAKHDDYGSQRLEIAQRLQKAGARPDIQTQRIIWRIYEKSLSDSLISAIYGSDAVKMRQVVGLGANVNHKNEDGATPLTTAIDNQDAKGVAFLLAQGAHLRTGDGNSILSYALLHGGDPKVLALLRNAGAPTNTTINFFIAVIQNRRAEVAQRLRLGMNINTTNNGAHDGWTPLIWAATDGNADMVRLLLEHGADARIKDKEGRTALSCTKEFVNDRTQRSQIETMLRRAMAKGPNSEAER